MKLVNFYDAWQNLMNTGEAHTQVRIVHAHGYGRELWKGTVADFCYQFPKLEGMRSVSSWIVVSYHRPAYTVEDENIPEYNRNIELRVI